MSLAEANYINLWQGTSSNHQKFWRMIPRAKRFLLVSSSTVLLQGYRVIYIHKVSELTTSLIERVFVKIQLQNHLSTWLLSHFRRHVDISIKWFSSRRREWLVMIKVHTIIPETTIIMSQKLVLLRMASELR